MEIRIKHFVKVPSSDCVIATAHDANRKTKVFLAVNGNGPIYKRNGINNTWDQLAQEDLAVVRQLITEGLNDKKIPSYTTKSLLN